MPVELGLKKRLDRVLGAVAMGALATGAAAADDRPAPVAYERFGDWQVTCAALGKALRCSALQQQGTKAISGQGIQRTIAVELTTVPNGAVGTLLTPFGVDLARGVVLRIDKAGPPLPFKTCLPAGCVVPLQFGRDAVQALRVQSVLHVSFVTAGDGSAIDLPISLNGLGQALDRLGMLEGKMAAR